ncbi:MAG: ABC transporter substrate-binding protein [Tissierellia bacterium]|nr:ABC transporter substrate-binding protein [Tissierellia bacterium]
MKNTKKIIGISLLLSLLLVGCSSKSNKQAEVQEEAIKVGIIQYMDHVSLDQAREGFIDELEKSDLNVEIEYENEQGDPSLTSTIPKKFEGDEYSLVYAIATPAAQGAKNALANKNIIFSAVTDPQGAGLVTDLEQPENVTGVSDYMDPKAQIETFLELYPDIKTMGTLYSTSEQNSQIQVEELQKACDDLGIELVTVGISNINDIPQGMASISSKIDAYFALTDNTVASAAPIVAEYLTEHKIPSVSAEEGQVKNGLLMSEGVDYYEQGAQAARMALKVLQGEEISTIPVEYNENNVMKVNEKMAQSLGLDLDHEAIKGAEIIK